MSKTKKAVKKKTSRRKTRSKPISAYQQKLNIRKQLYKKYRLQGMSGQAAALKAGYSRGYAAQATCVLENRREFKLALVKAGLTDELLATKLIQGLNATAYIPPTMNHDGFTVHDFSARHKYLQTALNLKGHVIRDGSEQVSNSLTINISLAPENPDQQLIDISSAQEAKVIDEPKSNSKKELQLRSHAQAEPSLSVAHKP